LDIPQIKDSWHKDIPAGLVVFLVALPLCIGIAVASGAPPVSGIITGIIGGILVGVLSNSAIAVSGPAAGLILVVSDAIIDLGSFEALLAAIVLSGVIQLVIGYFKGGILGEYFPSAVIKGMLAAIGLTLIFNQIPHAVGYDEVALGEDRFMSPGNHNLFTDLFDAFRYISWGAIIISTLSMSILLIWELKQVKDSILGKAIPGELVVVAVGIILNQFFLSNHPELYLSDQHLVAIPDILSTNNLSSFLTFPDFSSLGNYDTIVIAFLIAGVASLETLLSVDASDNLDPYKRHTDKNRELKAQGIGNMISGALGGLPMTAVIVRSSANINAGGRTKISAIVHGILLLVSILTIPGTLNMIPLACLAAILIKIGYKLSRIELYISMYHAGKPRFLNFIITIVAILLTDLLVGIVVGVIVAIFFILRENFKSNFTKIEKHIIVEETGIKRLETEIIFSENLTILNKANLQKTFSEIPAGTIVLLNAEKTNSIDYDTMEVIRNFIIASEIQGIEIVYFGFEKFFPRLEIDAYTQKTMIQLPREDDSKNLS